VLKAIPALLWGKITMTFLAASVAQETAVAEADAGAVLAKPGLAATAALALEACGGGSGSS
jgi:hypothetical protein